MNQKGFANIILIVVVVVLVGVVGYFAFVKKSEPVAQKPSPTPTQVSNTAKPNSSQTPAPTPVTTTERLEEPFVFVGKRTTGSNADLYKGYVIVEGEYYEYYPETLGGGFLFFKVDVQYKTKLPKKYGEYGERFALDSESSAKQMFKINESVFGDKSICRLFGRAKIAIEDYTVELLESAVWDHAKLVKVLSSTPQTTETCTER